jgi:crotonobetainyl-CoA:carnitine CoA-transferase CaiB-like acyl-CoA transferase
MLDYLRVLDLTDEKGFFCGRVLGDLGADVIKVERPRGDASRNIGPFYGDIPDPEKSLYWFAYNANKRGITLNIEAADGQQVFKRLTKEADFVIESFTPGYLDELGLGYSALSQINPRIILTSITPFGQTGPYKNYKGSDIVCWALSSSMFTIGDRDRPPVRISFPHAYVYGGAQAAAASLAAHYHRELTGEGQQVDVAIRDYLAFVELWGIPYWAMNKVIKRRAGPFRENPVNQLRTRLIWPCQDGHVVFLVQGGMQGATGMRALVDWMDSEGMATETVKQADWESFDMFWAPQETVDILEEPIMRFFLTHARAELYEGALERHIMLYGVSSINELAEDDQLAARDYWAEVEHPELDATITYPNAFAKFSETGCGIRRRAPLIGEHNEEIYEEELGLSRAEIVTLKQGGVI